jgi:hypothetical protein
MEVSTPIMVGGLVRWVADRTSRKKLTAAESESGPGVLFASGLIAGAAMAGTLKAFAFGASESLQSKLDFSEAMGAFAQSDLVSLLFFTGMAVLLYLVANEYLLKAPPASDTGASLDRGKT